MKRCLLPILLFFSLFAFSQEPKEEDPSALWYKKAIFYNLDIKVFKDSDGDGTGDIKGLIQQLPYLDSLGITAVWLAPFQPSPLQDDGYDVSDYYGIDKRLGTLADFKELLQHCNRLHIRLLMDLALNHTSTQHPWFQEARRNKHSPYHQWYVWSQDKPKNEREGMAFPGIQTSIWTYDSLSKAYYYHRFYDFQPDLNMQNPEVREEVKHILQHWTSLGVKGFRLDAVPFIIEEPTTEGDHFERKSEWLQEWRQFLTTLDKEALLLGEANVPPKENTEYFGKKGDRMNMLIHFYANQYLFQAFATEKPKRFQKALEATRDIPRPSQWAFFLRNHDEIDLGRLGYFEVRKVYKKMGPEKNMKLYDRGIRRRLAPMFHNDFKHLCFAYNVLFSLPFTPILRYGEEIGMGDDLSLKERESVRTPMQWNASLNAGFSSSSQLFRPVIDSGEYSFQRINVQEALQDSSSLLSTIKQTLLLRKQGKEIHSGNWKGQVTSSPHVWAIFYQDKASHLVVYHNFSHKAQKVILPPHAKLSSIQKLSPSVLEIKENTIKIEGWQSIWLRFPLAE